MEILISPRHVSVLRSSFASTHLAGWRWFARVLGALLVFGRALLVTGAVEAPRPTITDPAMVWAMPSEEKVLQHPLRIEGRVSYYDPGFRIFWIERNQVGVYVQLSGNPPLLHTGQYVVIEGKITPNRGLSAADVSVQVVDEKAPVTPLETAGRINDLTAFHGRVVTVEGYVDSQQLIDAEHLRMILIVENRPVFCWVKPDDPNRVPDWQGQFVRVTGLYSRRFDPTQTSASIELWLGRQDGVTALGTLENKAEFNQPVTPIAELYAVRPGTAVRVRGLVETQRIGIAMTVRDATGQVEIRSIQQRHLQAGSPVEVIGRVTTLSSGQWVLDPALYRPAPVAAKESDAVPPAEDGLLKTVAQIRALGVEEAALGRPVEITGMVTWSLPESDFLFLQDLTGGVRVYYDRAKTGDIRYGKYFQIRGVTRAGRVAPAVELREFTDRGSMSHPPAKPITLEQALTGREDGEWVELRGFVHDTVSEGDWRWINVTSPAGNFTGHLQNPVNFVANPGSLIRIHGVCETKADADGRITGITLRVPFLHDITIEEDAPPDYYDLPRRPLGDLAQLSGGQNMLRVRVTGTVQSAVPGQSVTLEEGHTGLLLLTHETQPLQPGDRIEAVGILGREGVRTILREAVWRKTGTGPAPEPLVLEEAKRLEPAADSRLVRLRGTLIDVFRRYGQTRLTLQQGNTLFDAILDQPIGGARLNLDLGAGLDVTGIYKLVFDDTRQSRSFQVQLRTPEDVRVYAPARLWTVQRALTVSAILGGCVLLGLAWIRALRRQVLQQTDQMRGQIEQQARLEAEVQRAARLESLGVLAGGIAHDYNNLLTVIMGNLSLMKFNPLVMGTESERVREIEHGTLRARDLTRQLITFAEGGEPMCVATNLSEIVHQAVQRVLVKTNIRCAYDIATDLRPALVDAEQIAQAVQNLLHNAMEAMPNGGLVRIVLANAAVDAGFFGLTPGHYLTLNIIDTGEGIPPDALPRIFDPFFTTKTSGGGLGLATVYSIIKKHRGHIQVQSRVGQGTTFSLWLPATEALLQSAPAGLPPPVQRASAALPARVLLMDDEDSIRRLGVILLQRMEFEPTAVADGASALREFEAARNAGRPFSLLILDLTIPGGLGGKATLEAIRKIDAEIPAIVSSGYSRDPVMANFRDHGFQAVVPKPYDIAKFTETIRQLVADRPAE